MGVQCSVASVLQRINPVVSRFGPWEALPKPACGGSPTFDDSVRPLQGVAPKTIPKRFDLGGDSRIRDSEGSCGHFQAGFAERGVDRHTNRKRPTREGWAFMNSVSESMHDQIKGYQLKIQSNTEKSRADGLTTTGRAASARVMVTVSMFPEDGTVR